MRASVRFIFRACLAWLLMTAGVVFPQAIAAAQSQGLGANRLIKLFDFEEADQGNYEDMPQHWYVIGRPAMSADPNFARIRLHERKINQGGYPRFTTVRFNRPQHEKGDHSLMMKLDGGNVGAYLEMGALPAIPMSEYLVTVRVSTDSLKRARARLSAYLVDRHGQEIPGSRRVSRQVRSQGQWRTLNVPLSAEFEDAAWIGLELEVLQPQPDPDSPLGAQQIVLEDIHGRVWWDDLAIWQLPQVSVNTQSPVNIIRAPKQPELTIRVRDVTGHPLVSKVVLYDVAGREIDRMTRTSGDGHAETWRWQPRIEKFGWYMADLAVYDTLDDTQAQDGRLLPGAIARSIGAFLYLPEQQDMHTSDATRFMLMATGIDHAQEQLVPRLLSDTHLKAVTLSLWQAMTTQAGLEKRESELDALINPIVATGSQVMLSMSPAPRELLNMLDLHDASVIEMFSHPQETWQPFVLPLLMRHGQTVNHWQLGTMRSPLEPRLTPLASQVAAAGGHLKQLVPDPVLHLPWSINYPPKPPVEAVTAWMLDVPPTVQAEHLGPYLKTWDGEAVWLVLREPPASTLDRQTRLDDLALRMIHAWEHDVQGLAISAPWAWTDSRHKSLMPDSLLGAFSQVGQYLSGRQAVGRLNLGKGLQCVIFDGPAGGMLAMWNESADQPDVAMYLGENPVAHDLFGNRTPLAKLGGVQRLKLTRTPVFITGIDPRMAMMRAHFTLDNPFIESTQTPHERTLTVINPWPRTITGTLQIVGPAGWRFTPGNMHFSIAAHGRMTLPMQMSFPVSEIAGDKQLVAKLVFQADQTYEVHLRTPMRLGLEHIRFDANVTYVRAKQPRRPGQVDAMVTQFVTNTGPEPVSLYAFAQTPGFARQEGIISRLKPGQSIIRRFRFEDVASQGPIDRPLRVGLRETRGPAVLNEMLRLKPPVVDD